MHFKVLSDQLILPTHSLTSLPPPKRFTDQKRMSCTVTLYQKPPFSKQQFFCPCNFKQQQQALERLLLNSTCYTIIWLCLLQPQESHHTILGQSEVKVLPTLCSSSLVPLRDSDTGEMATLIAPMFNSSTR